MADLGGQYSEFIGAVPWDLTPDPLAMVVGKSGDILFWSSPLRLGHLYVIWTREGNTAQVIPIRTISLREQYGEEIYPQEFWDAFVSEVVIQWAYQDDGSGEFNPKTVIQTSTWGRIKGVPTGQCNGGANQSKDLRSLPSVAATLCLASTTSPCPIV